MVNTFRLLPFVETRTAWHSGHFRDQRCIPIDEVDHFGDCLVQRYRNGIRFCRNSSAVGFSPSTISVTALTKIEGVENISATYATAAPWRGKQEKTGNLHEIYNYD